ncbi:MAG: AHH domain-containing protein [Muribaculaceae bacterium]|nr:AHH domain-containing protein [Muribaculaceae bacterium]
MVQDAINEGFKFNGQENIISLEKYSKATNQGQHGNHPAYNDQIKKLLDESSKLSGTATERINSTINKARTDIEAQPNVKVNDLFKPKK